MPKAFNLSAYVRENEEEGVVFLYKIIQGAVDKSYGIEVAKLAGLPGEIIVRARGVLEELENKNIKKPRLNPDQMGLFVPENREHAGVVKELQSLDVNNITPMEAINKLGEIKKKLL